MLTRFAVVVIAACLSAAAPMALCHAQEYYYDLDTTYEVVPASSRIAVQFDTTRAVPTESEFFTAHTCLNPAGPVTYLHRGFWVYGLNPQYGYEVAAAEVQSDPAVHRAVPVYVTPADMAEFKVSDLVDVQFDVGLSREEALALLASHGLRFVDSST